MPDTSFGGILQVENDDLILEGDLTLKLEDGTVVLRLDRESGDIFINRPDGERVFHFQGGGGNLRIGGGGTDGDILLFRRQMDNSAGPKQATVHIDGQRGILDMGGDGADGRIAARNGDAQQTAFIDGGNGQIIAGANGVSGTIVAQNGDNVAGGVLDGARSELRLGAAHAGGRIEMEDTEGERNVFLSADHTAGQQGDLSMFRLGSPARDGWVQIHRKGVPSPSIQLLGDLATITLGLGAGVRGSVGCFDEDSRPGASLSGDGRVIAGHREQVSGLLSVFSENSRMKGDGAFFVRGSDAFLSLGDEGLPGRAEICGQNGEAAVILDGQAGDIILANGDIAEDFALGIDGEVSPGTVMVASDDGRLQPSSEPYDKRVVGVVAGAGAHHPGMVLGRRADGVSRVPIALTGVVQVRVDADQEPVGTGDFLTTGDRPGVAMVASDAGRRDGTLIGKALAPLNSGIGLVPILVTLR